jgi:SEL1 protein
MGELVNNTAFLALTHWTRSAAQQNIDALVKVGDYYCEFAEMSEGPEIVD